MPRASLFEIRTVVEDPANLNSADAEYVVTADDSMDYVVKTCARHPMIPSSEWVCHRLAEACDIPTTQFGIVRLRNGVAGFGSQWDSSLIRNQSLINSVVTAIPGIPSLAKIFTQILVLDLFVHNEDRHLGNYFFVKTRQGIGVKVFDFSRGLFYHNKFPLPALPMGPRAPTIQVGRALRVAYPIVASSVSAMVGRIAGIATHTVEGWLNEMPVEWLGAVERQRFLAWWGSGSRDRILAVQKGINNGNLL